MYKLNGPIDKSEGTTVVNGCDIECVTYTSKYEVVIGIKTPWFDLSISGGSSTIRITICADGTTELNVDRATDNVDGKGGTVK
jgi:hypothetical protein